MWVQFRNIPFYLLTKKLAFDLGECIGKTRRVDDVAWGFISDKFVCNDSVKASCGPMTLDSVSDPIIELFGGLYVLIVTKRFFS